MKRALLLTVVGLVLASSVCSQPYGTGPGMMGGYGGGYGMGPGMMDGYRGGGYGMGPGMARGYWGVDLSADQRKKIEQIEEETAKARWQLMGTMHQKGYHMDGMFGRGAFDEPEARKAFQAMTDAQKAMFELNIEARKRIDAVLTKEQRDKLYKQ
ncbi:MAG: periplasmic heavy metal sensor [Rhodoferax sp.]|uniref:Spy/CpxP family protein refolding chaperone n=1 Tax=Rhodoferax sp. TaxID=50421 RepID=UPI0027189CB5|nr:periplasmic heavy metal sensor [Rhodoferax sp.]MDO8449129.1 periplasmic heavy metal sensor [Rhodoferax sp.]